jgi:hypothetical protein
MLEGSDVKAHALQGTVSRFTQDFACKPTQERIQAL